METIAVYWEERVRVYGITEKFGLALGILGLPAERMASWSERLTDLECSLQRFELVTGQPTDTGWMELSILVEQSARDILQDLMRDWLDRDPSAQFVLEEESVDMVFLHGPHFQDRFGIAETAFSALEKHDIPIVLSGCAGTSMYLIFTEGRGAPAKRILADTFLIPTTI